MICCSWPALGGVEIAEAHGELHPARAGGAALGVVLRVERGEDRALAVSSRVVATATPEERLRFLVATEPTCRIA